MCSGSSYIHIEISFGRLTRGPPPTALRQALLAVAVPMVTYVAESWYKGTGKKGQDSLVRKTNAVLAVAARAVAPSYCTAPNTAALRDARFPSGEVALEHHCLRCAFKLQANDKDHPLTARLAPELYKNGLRAGQPRAPRTRLHTAALESPSLPRPLLQRPRFTPGSNVDPTRGLDRKAAVVAHNAWHQGLPPSHTVVYTDGSEQNDESGRRVGYGFVVFSNGAQLTSGSGELHPEIHVFDAEAVGALRGLEAAIRAAGFGDITVCVDSTSVIWGLRGDAAMSSQWAYIDFHEAARSYQGLGEVDV